MVGKHRRRKIDRDDSLGGDTPRPAKTEKVLRDEMKKAAKRQRDVGMDLTEAVERRLMKPWKKKK